jgi:hypothetical protein
MRVVAGDFNVTQGPMSVNREPAILVIVRRLTAAFSRRMFPPEAIVSSSEFY